MSSAKWQPFCLGLDMLTIDTNSKHEHDRRASFIGCNLGPVSLTVFTRNSNSMETSPWHNSVAGHQIATNFCTCHDSTAVVPCAKFCSDHCIRIEVRVKWNFHRIWIAMEKPLVKRAPGSGIMTVCRLSCWPYFRSRYTRNGVHSTFQANYMVSGIYVVFAPT